MGIEEWIDEKIDKYDKVIKLNNDILCCNYNEVAEGENRTALNVIDDLEQLKSSLPTQPELVEVPEFVAELICWVKKNNAVPSDVISDFYLLAVDGINLPNTLDLEKLSVYFTLACHRFDFEKACITGYTVKKEQLYYVKVGSKFLQAWINQTSITPVCVSNNSDAWVFSKKDQADKVALLIGGEAVPVEEEPKLPQEIEVSEYLKEEE